MNVELDSTAAVRQGEDLDRQRLECYLQQHLSNLAGKLVIEQFPHGHSNLTYLLRMGVVELVLRRPPFGNRVASAHDMRREYRVLSKLSAVFSAAPCPYLFCDDHSILGSDFYVMERRRGIIFRKTIPAGLNLGPEQMRGLCQAVIENLAELHAIDYQSAGLADLGKPAGYVARQVSGWTKRYRDAQTDNVQSIDHVIDWLAASIPPESGACIIHNDFKFDNIVFDPEHLTKITAVLDWEMATLGDPLMDLGVVLGYWVEASDPEPLRQSRFGPTVLPGSLTRREVVELYEQTTGKAIPNPLYYYVFGLFKIAVIVQQIYSRFVQGHTSDPRFAGMDRAVTMLGQQAQRALDSGKL